ncbi:MAG: type 3 dihydrofolate reductase [Gammaproteobacteria bacterium]|nr:type 3 dihydrofolate reductase [Gammaproteobacteria bacterium]
MTISIIVAMDKKGVIGLEGDLPWYLSADLKRFKAMTMGKPLIMGRKTHESIGRPLPGRKNIILTQSQEFKAEGCTVVHSLEEALLAAGEVDEVMIMGGSGIYDQSLDRANRLYITEVHADVSGDVYFPEFDGGEWVEIEREDHSADDKNDFDYSFVVKERK